MYDNVIFGANARGHIGTQSPPLSMAFAIAPDRRAEQDGLGKSKKNKEKIRD